MAEPQPTASKPVKRPSRVTTAPDDGTRHSQLQPALSSAGTGGRSYSAPLAVASTGFQLRRYESAPLTCCQTASYLGRRPRSVHRLGHQHARACDRYCESVLYSATYDMQLRSVRRCLSDQALLTLIRAVVVSKVDYCCSVLVSISGHLTDRRQSLLNTATRLVFSARRS